MVCVAFTISSLFYMFTFYITFVLFTLLLLLFKSVYMCSLLSNNCYIISTRIIFIFCSHFLSVTNCLHLLCQASHCLHLVYVTLCAHLHSFTLSLTCVRFLTYVICLSLNQSNIRYWLYCFFILFTHDLLLLFVTLWPSKSYTFAFNFLIIIHLCVHYL